MPLATAVTVVLLILAAILFGLAACSAPTGRFQTGWAGMLLVTLAVWLLPLLIRVA